MKITGDLFKVFPTKAVGKYKITDFWLKDAKGQVIKCQTFGVVETGLLGGPVEFQGELNDYQKWVVARNTEIIPLDEAPVTETQTATAVAEEETSDVDTTKSSTPTRATRRGRPSKTANGTPNTTSVVPTTTTKKESGRDDYRDEAVSSVKANLSLAIGVAEGLGIKEYTVSDLVALGDMIGRTQTAIFMDAKKDGRMTSFKK